MLRGACNCLESKMAWQRRTVETERLYLTETLKKLMMLMAIVMMTVILSTWIGYTAALCIL
jgi:hypothetical protein